MPSQTCELKCHDLEIKRQINNYRTIPYRIPNKQQYTARLYCVPSFKCSTFIGTYPRGHTVLQINHGIGNSGTMKDYVKDVIICCKEQFFTVQRNPGLTFVRFN